MTEGKGGVVVQRGEHFETAAVSELTMASVRLRGGWSSGGFGALVLVLAGDHEIQMKLVDEKPGNLLLKPSRGPRWAPDDHKALADALES